MPAKVHVRFGLGGERKLIEASTDLFEGPDDEVDIVADTLYQKRVTKSATLYRIDGSQNPHDKLSLRSEYSYNKDPQSILLRDEDEECSLSNLFDFLLAARHVNTDGEYIVLNASDFNAKDTESLMNILLQGEERLQLLPMLIDAVESQGNAGQLKELISANPEKSRFFTASINHLRMTQALEKLRTMVCNNELEIEFQRFLEENYWIFGSEYCELIPKRQITSDKRLDFPLRRTSDEYFEVIEIKRPGVDLFRKMTVKRDDEYEYEVYVERPKLVDAIGQVDDYLAEMDAEQYAIYAKSKQQINVEKARGKVIIGRDENDDAMRALRRLNGRLNRIEVLTYDQLLAIGQRVVDMLGRQELCDETENNELSSGDEYSDA